MNQPVLVIFQVLRLNKAFATEFASKRPFTGVNSQVGRQVSLLPERFGAMFTDEGLFSCVASFMLGQLS